MTRKLSSVQMLSILTGLNLFNYLDRYVLNAVRTPIAAEFHIGYGDSGRLFSAFMLGYFITSPFFGYLGDRLSRKYLIVMGIIVWSLGTVLTGIAGSFAVLLLYRALVGVGEASYATLSPSLISDTWAPVKRNNALTIFYVAIPVGSALGYILGGWVWKHYGWRDAFFWAGAPGFLLAMLLLPFAEPKRGESDGEVKAPLNKPRIREVFGLFANGSFNLVVWGYVAYTFALGAFAFWGPTFLERVHGIATDRADHFFGLVIVVAGLGGTLIGGFGATWWQRHNKAGYAWTLTGSALLAVPLSLMAVLTATTGLAMAFLAAAIFLLFLCTGPVNTLILESVPANVRSSAMALSIFLIHLFGDMWSPEIVGRTADYFGGNLQKAVIMLPASLMIAAILWGTLGFKMSRRSTVEV